ncbi:exonuclease domain-containing protein [Saccharothrix australiensis]|uniref:DNA polymerase III epsilon subunit n=1 Tax=Saccharothrix australiensis TaxID=2072 RepID=A0A495VW02_9PSEU|nr:exonuclease domain-containing protein [Saccharothrix australiensis]RKT53090.1 DNA polymerase III epsilon subunit [Saccharothrix australiensis]
MSNREQSWALGSMIALDLETTDTNPHRDRIVTAAVVAITVRVPGARPEVTTRTWLADPGVDIPVEATAIHGISTDHARREGSPAPDVVAEVAGHLAGVWTADTPLCAFNAAFDLTMLDAELRRHHGRGLPLSGPVVDPLCIDRRLRPVSGWQDKRTLADVCAHYRVRLEGAHTSDGDAIAAARLAWAMAKRYPEAVGLLDPRVLHRHQADWYREQENAYAARQERKLGQLIAHGGDRAQVDWLRDRIAGIRARAESWPLLPDTGAGAAHRRVPPGPGASADSYAPC